MGCLFMMPRLRMFSGFSVVLGGMFVMFGSFHVVFVNSMLFHEGIPGCSVREGTLVAYQRHNEANVTS